MASHAPDSVLQEHAVPSSGAAGQGHAPHPPAAPPETPRDGEISLLDLLIVLAARKRLIFWITAAFAILAIVVSLLLPVRYTATVVLLPPQQNSSLGNQLAAQLGSFGGVAATLTGGGSSLLRNPNDMYVAMFRSRVVEDAMIDHFDLMQEYQKKYLSDARKKFEHYATLDGSGKDGLIHIWVEDHNPQRAADLANGYVDQFRNLSEHLAITEAGQRRLFFEKQLQQANQSLADAEESLKETEQKTGLIAIDAQTRALIESAASLRAQIAAKEVQIQGMQTYATGENAQLVEAQQELDSLQAQLARLGGGSDNSGGIIVPKGQMTEAGVEYVRKLRDVKYYETIFDILARQFELAKLDEAKEGALIQVVDPAVPPDKKSFPKRALIVVGSTMLGLLLGVFTALFQAGLQRVKDDPEAASKLRHLSGMLRLRG
jgi:tyrosine-protein kinase Etk/Wzc